MRIAAMTASRAEPETAAGDVVGVAADALVAVDAAVAAGARVAADATVAAGTDVAPPEAGALLLGVEPPQAASANAITGSASMNLRITPIFFLLFRQHI